MVHRSIAACSLLTWLLAPTLVAQPPKPTLTPLLRAVDLNRGESQQVKLADGKQVTVKLLDLQETTDPIRGAVRLARVHVEVDGHRAWLTSANYQLPVPLGPVQIDCSITGGRCRNTSTQPNPWGLEKDARLRLWPAGSPWMNPGTFLYPIKQRWFASSTQMANEPVYVDHGEQPKNRKIYYHYGLDFGGAEGLAEVVAATDGLVVSAGKDVLPGYKDTPVATRYDVVYVLDSRGWYHRYSHLFSIDKAIRPGVRVRMGQPVGLLGKEGGSGGWSHLHFGITCRQPSGRWGALEPYALAWEAYQRQYHPKLTAVARPHHFAQTGDKVTLDATRSTSAADKIVRYQWTFTDGTTAEGPKVERVYSRPGYYSEILKVTDSAGRSDYDFTVVVVLDRKQPDQSPPSIHAVYHPTFGIRPGDEVTFKVRAFGTTDGQETWDFGDGSPAATTRSDGNVVKLAKDGYAVLKHTFAKPGRYVVRVQRTDNLGRTAFGHVQVAVGEGSPTASVSAATALADGIQLPVRQAAELALAARAKAQANAPKLDSFRHLVRSGTWTEVWPDQQGKPQTRQVTGEVWTAAIQAAIDQHNTVTIPAREQPYYLDAPLVLKSGQSLTADAKAEIRLQPGVNTCMVRNAHIVGAQDGPVPANVEPDRHLVIEGGIWTTLATMRGQGNGNTKGRSAKQDDVLGCHGVILLSNVRGAVVRNVTVRQSRAFGIHLSNCRDFLVEGAAFEDHGRDGVHVNGPSSYGVIRNVRGVTHDDFVALNAWEWRGYTPTFGPIHHVLVEDVSGTDRPSRDYASPYPDGTAEIRLLPGTKVFAGSARLACDISDCVFRRLTDIRTMKLYDQPNLELGRDNDFADPIGTLRNIYISQLVFQRPGRLQIAANVEGMTIDDVQLQFNLPTDVKLVAIGPMSATCKFKPDDPSKWTEIFSPDRDVTVRGFRLSGVRMLRGGQLVSMADAASRLVEVADQKPNPDYPKTTPRGGVGKARLIP